MGLPVEALKLNGIYMRETQVILTPVKIVYWPFIVSTEFPSHELLDNPLEIALKNKIQITTLPQFFFFFFV